MRELILRFDLDTVLWVVLRRRRGVDTVMRFITHLGDGPLWGLLGGALVLFGGGGVPLLAQFGLAYGIEISVYRFTKRKVTRPRPFLVHPLVTGLVIPPDEFSFPSGHTAAACVMAVVAGAYLPAILPLLLALAMLIGLSRIYLGVHFPTDVLAGAGLGTTSGLLALALL